MADEEKPEEEYKGSYKKRGWGFWLVVYLIVAIVLYAIIYYAVLARRGSSEGTTTPSTNQGLY